MQMALNDTRPAASAQRVCCVYCRISGKKILPVQQSLIDMQANVIALHCKILKLDCVGYLIPGDVPDIHEVLQQGLSFPVLSRHVNAVLDP